MEFLTQRDWAMLQTLPDPDFRVRLSKTITAKADGNALVFSLKQGKTLAQKLLWKWKNMTYEQAVSSLQGEWASLA